MFSKRGLPVFLGGLGGAVFGFAVLTLANPSGSNWAATAAPLLIVFGYGFMVFGLILKDPSSPTPLP